MISELIRQQAWQCLIMICCGMSTMVVYETLEFLIQELKVGKAGCIVIKVFFYIAAAFLFVEFCYYCAKGKIMAHIVIGYGVGLLLWRRNFYDIIKQGK